MTGIPFSFSSKMSGMVSGIPGLFTTSSAVNKRSSVCCFSSKSISNCVRTFWYFSLIFPLSERNTSYPFCCAKTAAPQPLSPPPSTTSFFIYRSFSVTIVKMANITPTIQKRVTILLSCMPSFWK